MPRRTESSSPLLPLLPTELWPTRDRDAGGHSISLAGPEGLTGMASTGGAICVTWPSSRLSSGLLPLPSAFFLLSHLHVYLCSLRFLFYPSLLFQDPWVCVCVFSSRPPPRSACFLIRALACCSLPLCFSWGKKNQTRNNCFPCKVSPGRASPWRATLLWWHRNQWQPLQPSSPVRGDRHSPQYLSPPREGDVGMPCSWGALSVCLGLAQVPLWRCFPQGGLFS